jgi:hypothetical protein
MSFREKSAWISFVSIAVVFGVYAWNSHQVFAPELTTAAKVAVLLLAAFVLLEVLLHVAVALKTPGDALARRDERERLIEMKATHMAFQVLVIGALASAGLMYVTRSAWAIGQHVLLAVVVAELVRFGGQILYYRRGV